MNSVTLKEIAQYLKCELVGDPEISISGIATLSSARPGELSFLHNPAYVKQLETTAASAVILAPDVGSSFQGAQLRCKNPYLSYAKVTALWASQQQKKPSVHPSAIISDSARLDPTVSVGPGCVIGDHVTIGPHVFLGPYVTLGDGVTVGSHSSFKAQVTVYPGCVIGSKCIIHSGVVIGADGFGFANDNGVWQKIHQLGAVLIHNEVEVGANTTIDRGALNDTIIGFGVKIDNQVQIGHNVIIGDNSIIAGCVGIAGSTVIGKRCMIGGASGVAGHLQLADDVTLTGMSMVTHSITKAGVYSSGTGLSPNSIWRRNAARFRHLDALHKQTQSLQHELQARTVTEDEK